MKKHQNWKIPKDLSKTGGESQKLQLLNQRGRRKSSGAQESPRIGKEEEEERGERMEEERRDGGLALMPRPEGKEKQSQKKLKHLPPLHIVQPQRRLWHDGLQKTDEGLHLTSEV